MCVCVCVPITPQTRVAHTRGFNTDTHLQKSVLLPPPPHQSCIGSFWDCIFSDAQYLIRLLMTSTCSWGFSPPPRRKVSKANATVLKNCNPHSSGEQSHTLCLLSSFLGSIQHPVHHERDGPDSFFTRASGELRLFQNEQNTHTGRKYRFLLSFVSFVCSSLIPNSTRFGISTDNRLLEHHQRHKNNLEND